MFVEQLRRAVEATPRVELPKVSALLWRAYAAGHVTEAQASELSEAIEARRALPVPPPRPRLRVGSRPRTPESLARRRRWVASGLLPPALASRFTAAETAVLSVVAMEVVRHGRCTLVIEHMAALAGVGRSTVKRALRAAQELGLLRIEERRLTAWRNAPNVLTITSGEWSGWLRMRRASRPRGEGSNSEPPRVPEFKSEPSKQRNRTWAAEGQGAGRAAPQRDSCGAGRWLLMPQEVNRGAVSRPRSALMAWLEA